MRKNGIEWNEPQSRAPLTFIGEFFDRVFDNEYMRLHFPSKKFM